MQRLFVLSAIALLGCDARAGEEYRGEVLLQMKGSLLLEAGQLAPDSVPALAFPDRKGGFHVLDVEAHGEFPASFSIDVMSPPPPAAIQNVPGLPGFAVSHITALPSAHEETITYPTSSTGGGETWCENADDSDCYRRIDVCTSGTDQCFHELARCTPRHFADTEGPWCDDDTLGEVLESTGDPSLWYHWAKFAGLSRNYAVLYIDGDAPAGSARKYIESALDLGHSSAPARVFNNDEPIEAGYYLVSLRSTNQAEVAAAEACFERIDRECTREYNKEHGTSYERYRDLEDEVLEAGGEPLKQPEHRALMTKIMLKQYDERCQVIGVEYKRVDPQRNSITVMLGARELQISL